jgi:hypothetical protein
LFNAAVEMVTSDGAIGPAIRALLELPISVMDWFCAPASARQCASCSALRGTMIMN